MTHFKHSCLMIAACLLSASCTTPTSEISGSTSETSTSLPKQNITNSTSPQKVISSEKLTRWNLTGAIAAKRNKKAWSASVTWNQKNSQDYLIHLIGPFGGGNVILDKNGQQLTYQDGEKIRKSTDDQKLLYEETGTRIPLKQLYYWVRGIKAPGEISHAQYDTAGHLIAFQQSGYSIQYADYRKFFDYELPTKVRIDHSEGFVKLAIKQWNIS